MFRTRGQYVAFAMLVLTGVLMSFIIFNLVMEGNL